MSSQSNFQADENFQLVEGKNLGNLHSKRQTIFLTLSIGTGSCFLSVDLMKVQSAGEISRSHKAFLVCHYLFQLLQNLCFQRSFPVGQIGSSTYKSNYSLKGLEGL